MSSYEAALKRCQLRAQTLRERGPLAPTLLGCWEEDDRG